MKKEIRLLLLLVVGIHSEAIVNAQTQFVSQGKIEYERKINVHRQAEGDDENSEWFKEYVSKLPRFNTSYFDLSFTGNKTIYRPSKLKEIENNGMERWMIGPAKDNMIVTDLDRHQFNGVKNVYEATYSVQDSTRSLEWKISNETRTIAGFECRKAVARICDSVYVVAFYTDEITVSGGPESFNGLPGMILGLAIPRLYTTWFATKVELAEPQANEFALSTKGKKMSQKDLQSTLQKSLKDWGKNAQRNIWWVML